jgi:hypothetical protein
LSTYRLPLESLAGCLATLVVLVPREVLMRIGWQEEPAWVASGGSLLVLALTAIGLRRTALASRRYTLGGLPFQLTRFFSEFALYAFAELALVAGVWFYARQTGLLS